MSFVTFYLFYIFILMKRANNSVVDCNINSYPFLLKTCVDWLLVQPFPILIPHIIWLFKVYFFLGLLSFIACLVF